MAGNRIIEFVEEGVRFTLPHGLDHAFIERLEIETIEGDGEFNPHRYVLQVLMFTKEEIDTDIRKFCRKLRLQVNYDQDDLDNAMSKNEKYPILGIFDGKIWHTPGSIEGKVEYGPPFSSGRWIGSAAIELDAWDDPLITWGP